MSKLLFSSAPSTRRGGPHAGFTLIELLVVIGIIVVLISILLPAAAAVRKRAYATSTSQEIATIASACQAYYQDYHSYPGPVAENDIDGVAPSVAGTPTAIATFALKDGNGNPVINVTSSENLVLGLTGGLNLTFTSGAAAAFNYTASIITQSSGPQSLNTLLNSQKQSLAYYSPKPEELPPTDTTTAANYLPFGSADSVVPEYLDHIPGNVIGQAGSVANLPPLNYGPILYMRARVASTSMLSEGTGSPIGYQYNFSQLAPYGLLTTNVSSKDFPAGPYGTVTYDSAMDYIANPALANTPKGKDAFILISAGSDRIFGTKDDIIYGN